MQPRLSLEEILELIRGDIDAGVFASWPQVERLLALAFILEGIPPDFLPEARAIILTHWQIDHEI